MCVWSSASGVVRAAVVFLFLVLLSACGKGQATWRDQVASCTNISDDQRGSFMAPIPGTIQVLVDNTFSAEQKSGIHAMIAQWNQLGQTLQGADFFTEVAADVPDELRNGNFQNCDIDVGTGPNSVYLVNETSATHWTDLGFTDHIPGATMRCYVDDYLDKQEIVVRPDLVDASQFTSVVLHELGHSIGLGHSCQSGTGSPDFASCDGLSADNPYAEAVMYPTLGTEISVHTVLQIKDQLQSNDIARTSCLY